MEKTFDIEKLLIYLIKVQDAVFDFGNILVKKDEKRTEEIDVLSGLKIKLCFEMQGDRCYIGEICNIDNAIADLKDYITGTINRDYVDDVMNIFCDFEDTPENRAKKIMELMKL